MHPTNPSLRPVAALPLLPDLDMAREQYVDVVFDDDPAADLAGGNLARGKELVGTRVMCNGACPYTAQAGRC